MTEPPTRTIGAAVAAGAAFGIWLLAGAAGPAVQSPASKALPPNLFQGWPGRAPDVALVLSGEQHSYIKFCGCSQPQQGGFERRYNFIAKLKEKGWPVVALDLGDIVKPKTGSIQQQTLLKYVTAMGELNALGYSAMGVGENEFNLPLIEGLSRHTLQKPDANPRILAANLKDRLLNFPLDDKRSMLGDAALVPVSDGLKIGVVSVVGPSVRQNINEKTLEFDENKKVLPEALTRFQAAGAGLRVLLYQGLPHEAKAVVKDFPGFNVVLCKSAEEEPPAAPEMVGQTMIVTVGWRGRYVGVVGVFKGPNGSPPTLHYQLVAMGEEYETDPDKVKGHPAIEPLEEYARQVRSQNLIYLYPRTEHPTQVKHKGQRVAFVGSDKCKTCHEADYAKWKESKHSHAIEALEKYADKPSLRQFDPECVYCHTVGFKYKNGYVSEDRTPHLKNVGCENCHGPGELHVSNPTHKGLALEMSPWKSSPADKLSLPDGKYNETVLKAVDVMCATCHDQDNDPKYRFEKNWPLVEHGKKQSYAGGK